MSLIHPAGLRRTMCGCTCSCVFVSRCFKVATGCLGASEAPWQPRLCHWPNSCPPCRPLCFLTAGQRSPPWLLFASALWDAGTCVAKSCPAPHQPMLPRMCECIFMLSLPKHMFCIPPSDISCQTSLIMMVLAECVWV